MSTKISEIPTLETLLDFLKSADMAARPVAAGDDLLTTGLLDSLKILSLVTFIEQEFDIQVPMEDILPENFGSAQAISAYLDPSLHV